MTESPRRNILEMNRSLVTGLEAFFPLPVFGISVHISFTFSRIMLQWRSNAFIRASSLRLFRRLISTCGRRGVSRPFLLRRRPGAKAEHRRRPSTARLRRRAGPASPRVGVGADRGS